MINLKQIGVVITRYNETAYELNKAILSVLENGIEPCSICVINDNPTDPVKLSQFKNINIINSATRSGVSASRNLGINFFSEKEWIGFLDADDYWHKEKLFEQISKIEPNINLISTGMIEKSWFGDLVRLPNKKELLYGGNPCFMSTILIRNNKDIFFDEVKIEDRDFVSKYHINEVLIIEKALVDKFNYINRRGKNFLASFESKNANINKNFKPIPILFYKIKSISKINIYLGRSIFSILSNIFPNNAGNIKRIGLSLNFTSSEYKNLVEFCLKFDIKILLYYFFRLKMNKRNRYLLESNTFTSSLIAFICGLLENVRYIYVGLPGARYVSNIIELMPHKKFIHVCHGLPNSFKFQKKTYGAIVTNQTFELNCLHKKVIRQSFNIKYSIDKHVWFHGFKKGNIYSFKNLLNDIKLINKINSKNNLVIYPHPSAILFKLYLFIAAYNTKKITRYGENSLSAEFVYISSPTIKNILLSEKYDSRVQFVILR